MMEQSWKWISAINMIKKKGGGGKEKNEWFSQAIEVWEFKNFWKVTDR